MYGKLGHKKFNFGAINGYTDCKYDEVIENKCGTVGCAMGELPVIDPRNWRFIRWSIERKNGYKHTGFDEDIADYFGITEDEVDKLFYHCDNEHGTDYGFTRLKFNATKKQVANNILKFINWKLSNNE